MMADKELRGSHLALADVDVDDAWLHESATAARPASDHGVSDAAGAGPLFDEQTADHFRAEWLELQSRFVDDPNLSVRAADELVDQLIRRITAALNEQRRALAGQAQQSDRQTTEDRRVALQVYRALFQRLLALAA